jgi:sugar diacid utilization regulator
MNKLTKTWLFQQLAKVYGKELLTVSPTPLQSDLFVSFPIKVGFETLGWIGVDKYLLQADTQALVNILVEAQSEFYYREEETEEMLWRRFIEEDLHLWRDQWINLGYEAESTYKHVYLYVEEGNDIDIDVGVSLKEITESVLEEKSFLVHLYQRHYVWIIPNYTLMQHSLLDVLKGLADTITSECMINVSFYIGQEYLMPSSVRELVKEELSHFQLALNAGWDKPIIEWKDLTTIFLLDKCNKEDIRTLIDRLIGPVREDTELLHSIETFCRENLNVSETAKRLFIHRNSLQYRIEKFNEKIGLDVRKFEDAIKVYIAIQAQGMFHKE